MRVLCAILIVTLLASCARGLAPTASTNSSDTVRVETVIHDTVVYSWPVVTELHDTIPCDLNYDTTIRKEGTQLTVYAHGGILKATCKSDSLKEVIRTLQKTITDKKNSNTTITVTKEIKVPVTKYPKILWYSLALNGLSIAGFLLKSKAKPLSIFSTIFNLFKK